MRAARLSQIILPMGFLVWVIYGTLAGMGHWAGAVVVGLIAAVCLVALEAAAHIQIKLLDWVFLSYFAIATVATFVIRSSAFPGYSSIVIWVLYAGVTWASILLGTPFSLQYARESTPPEVWSTPVFLRANQVISTVWGVAFTLNIALVVMALSTRFNTILLGVIAPLLMMTASTVFTSCYTWMSRERVLAAAAH